MGAITDLQVKTVAASTFFELVDGVLEAVGRARLSPDGPQRQIVMVHETDRVLQILAGPGAGKTEMLVWRVLYELFVVGTPSDRIMLTTFTNRAATELSVRLVERSDEFVEQARALGLIAADPHVHDLRVGTIHSLCDSLLAEFDVAYMAAGTSVIDEVETRIRMAREHRYTLGYSGPNGPLRLINRLLRPELVALFRAPWDGATWPGSVFDRVQFLMALVAQHTETWIPRCAEENKPNGIQTYFKVPGLTEELVELQRRWQDYLDRCHILDFATLQYRFLQSQKSILPHLTHVFVDEFQDTNPIQLAIHVGWLASPATRLTCVGDDDQAVYRFRGSDIRCFTSLQGLCESKAIAFRQEKLEENWRSTKNIVGFTEAYRGATVLHRLAMPKRIQAPAVAPVGAPVRLLQGPWEDLCRYVAQEVAHTGAGRLGGDEPPTVAMLMFSTSERSSVKGSQPALDLHQALIDQGLRVYNPRNKTAARKGSPIYELTALPSYLIDPVVKAPAGNNGRMVEVWASMNDSRAHWAPTLPPEFPIATAHAQIQKGYIKQDGAIGTPGPLTQDLLEYVSTIRSQLVRAVRNGERPRLTLSGLVARLLTFPRFHNVGFNHDLFRQALFTQLLESNIAPTRLSRTSLDRPLHPELIGDRVKWPPEIWQFIGLFGSFVQESALDDVEVEELAERAVAMLTFHQTKGLEFDHVYVGLTSRQLSLHPVLRTKVFSGEVVAYTVDAGSGQPETKDQDTLELAMADREREVYVALTRAKRYLTILHDPDDSRPMSGLNPGIDAIFESLTPTAVPGWKTLTSRSFNLA